MRELAERAEVDGVGVRSSAMLSTGTRATVGAELMLWSSANNPTGVGRAYSFNCRLVDNLAFYCGLAIQTRNYNTVVRYSA